MKSMSELSFTSGNDTNQGHNSVADWGEGTGGLSPTPWGLKSQKKFFGDRPPTYLRIWMTALPLSQGLDPAVQFYNNTKYNT